jgi:alpha-N-arabinofuranosidase
MATLDTNSKSGALFILNRDLNNARDLEIDWHDLTPTAVTNCQTITGNDLKAVNSFEQPNRVVPQKLDPPKAGQKMRFQVPARSYTLLTISL